MNSIIVAYTDIIHNFNIVHLTTEEAIKFMYDVNEEFKTDKLFNLFFADVHRIEHLKFRMK